MPIRRTSTSFSNSVNSSDKLVFSPEKTYHERETSSLVTELTFSFVHWVTLPSCKSAWNITSTRLVYSDVIINPIAHVPASELFAAFCTTITVLFRL